MAAFSSWWDAWIQLWWRPHFLELLNLIQQHYDIRFHPIRTWMVLCISFLLRQKVLPTKILKLKLSLFYFFLTITSKFGSLLSFSSFSNTSVERLDSVNWMISSKSFSICHKSGFCSSEATCRASWICFSFCFHTVEI